MKVTKRIYKMIFAAIMVFIMVTIMTFFMTWIDMGYQSQFLLIWLKKIVLGYIVAYPAALLAMPVAEKLLSVFVEVKDK